MTTTDGIDGQPPAVVGQKLASALLGRLPALTDELLKCVLKQGEACGDQSDIYGDDRLVTIDDLYHSLQDNLRFILSNLGCPGSYDLAAPRRTGPRRAEQEAPLAAVQSSLQVGFRFMWDSLVAEAHQTGIVSDAELVSIASEVWMLNSLFTTELATAYRDAMAERVLRQDQARSARGIGSAWQLLPKMDRRIFRPDPMGLREDMLRLPLDARFSYDQERNILYLNFEGLQVKSMAVIEDILAKIREICEPLDHKVYAVVNYDRFELDKDLEDAYLDGVQEMGDAYFHGVTRFTTSAFMRAKLGDTLESRGLAPHIYESRTRPQAPYAPPCHARSNQGPVGRRDEMHAPRPDGRTRCARWLWPARWLPPGTSTRKSGRVTLPGTGSNRRDRHDDNGRRTGAGHRARPGDRLLPDERPADRG